MFVLFLFIYLFIIFFFISAPIVIPCLVSSIMIQSTIVTLQTSGDQKDIFYPSRTDRFNLEY